MPGAVVVLAVHGIAALNGLSFMDITEARRPEERLPHRYLQDM